MGVIAECDVELPRLSNKIEELNNKVVVIKTEIVEKEPIKANKE